MMRHNSSAYEDSNKAPSSLRVPDDLPLSLHQQKRNSIKRCEDIASDATETGLGCTITVHPEMINEFEHYLCNVMLM